MKRQKPAVRAYRRRGAPESFWLVLDAEGARWGVHASRHQARDWAAAVNGPVTIVRYRRER